MTDENAPIPTEMTPPTPVVRELTAEEKKKIERQQGFLVGKTTRHLRLPAGIAKR